MDIKRKYLKYDMEIYVLIDKNFEYWIILGNFQ